MKKTCIYIVFFLFSVACAYSQVQFRLDAPAIATTEEVISVKFILRDAKGSNLRAPTFAGFIVASGPKKTTYTAGGHTYESYEYGLVAAKTGVLRIDPALIYADNRALKSNSAEVRASEPYNKSSATDGQFGVPNVQDVPVGKPFMRANFDRKRAYTNYPVVLTYTLYVPSTMEVSAVDIAKRISLGNATSREVDVSREQPRELVVGGAKYRSYLLKKYVVSAISAQSITTGEFSVRGESVQWQKDEFGRRQRKTDEFVVSAESVYLEFAELPQPKPEPNALPFKDFNAVSDIDREKYKVGETAIYRVVISGAGMLESVEMPEIPTPAGTIPVSKNTVDDIRYGDSEAYGKRTFEYTFEFREPGLVEFPAVAFVFFDIETGKYRTATALAKRVSIDGAGAAEESDKSARKGTNYSIWLGIAFFILLCCFFVFAFIAVRRRKRMKENAPPPQSPRKEPRKDNDSALEVLCELLSVGEIEKFFAMADVFLRQQAATDDAPKPTNEEMEALLRQKGTPPEKIMQIMSAIERIEFAVYTSTYSKAAADSVLNDLIRLFATK